MTASSRPREESEQQRPPLLTSDEQRIESGTSQLPNGEPERSISGTIPASEQTEAATDERSLSEALAERTADLQRVKAEYDNYRKRVHRERLAIGERATADVLRTFLPILDTIDYARAHEDTAAAFDTVATKLQDQLAALGVQRFGAAGEPFDPARHEALTSTESDRLDHPTCTRILQPGYRLGDVLLRPARVEVAQPAPGLRESGDEEDSADEATAEEATAEES